MIVEEQHSKQYKKIMFQKYLTWAETNFAKLFMSHKTVYHNVRKCFISIYHKYNKKIGNKMEVIKQK